jgi:NADPH:quinone reductase-like Zn-dependent oxidoreductase
VTPPGSRSGRTAGPVDVGGRVVAGSMRALRAHQWGGPETLVVEDAPIPSPGRGEVLVAVQAAAVTFGELGWEETWTRGGLDRTPVVLAHEFSGVVAELGDGVAGLVTGQEVYGLAPFDHDGAAAEYVVVPATHVAPRPRTLDAARAAALALSGLTARQALVDHAAVRPEDSVLVQGAAGGVGVFAVQMARVLDAQVTATCRARDVDFVAGLGAHRVLDIESHRLTAGTDVFDVVIDCVGGDVAVDALALLRPGTGRLVTLTSPLPEGVPDRRRATFFIVAADRAQLRSLAEMADRHGLQVPLTATFPLEHGREAYASGRHHGRAPGKTVITVP